MAFTTGGSRPAWQGALLVAAGEGRVGVRAGVGAAGSGGLHASTAMMGRMVRQRAMEPPDGRFSHLLGRYVAWGGDGRGVLRLPDGGEG